MTATEQQIKETKRRSEDRDELIKKAAYWKYMGEQAQKAGKPEVQNKAAMHFSRIVQKIQAFDKTGKFKTKQRRAK